MSRCCNKENSPYFSLKRQEGSWHCWARDYLFAKSLKPSVVSLLSGMGGLGLDYASDISLDRLCTAVLSPAEGLRAIVKRRLRSLPCAELLGGVRSTGELESLWRVRDVVHN